MKSDNKILSNINNNSLNSNIATNINNVNIIKIPSNSNKDKSRSPQHKKHINKSSQTPDKDKVVFIKTQLKNEIANFTGFGKKLF